MRTAVLLAACLLAASCAHACIYKYGSSPDSLAAPAAGTKWTHGFLGDDWNGTDGAGKPWVCLTGKKQSPINIPGPNRFNGLKVDSEFQTRWYFPDLVSNGSNLEVINTGHTIQVEWKYNYGAEVSIAVPANASATTPVTAVLGMKAGDAATWAKAVPAQFHFHSHSEHTLDGRQFPLELHIVHSVTDPALPACAGGCFSVLGILFEIYDGPDNVLLKTIWDNMPTREGAINYVPAGAQIPLGDMLPNEDLRDYVTYEGSLTTPPCSEGLLWHVLTKPQRISVNQWRKYLSAVGMKDCTKKSSPAASPAAAPAAGRRMLEETKEDGAEYECKVGAYGYNYRLVQPINGRVVKAARAW